MSELRCSPPHHRPQNSGCVHTGRSFHTTWIRSRYTTRRKAPMRRIALRRVLGSGASPGVGAFKNRPFFQFGGNGHFSAVSMRERSAVHEGEAL
jgi:hypothetical protein